MKIPTLALLLVHGMAGALPAAPLDLQDPRPRWVSVRFETSPRTLIGQGWRGLLQLFQRRLAG